MRIHSRAMLCFHSPMKIGKDKALHAQPSAVDLLRASYSAELSRHNLPQLSHKLSVLVLDCVVLDVEHSSRLCPKRPRTCVACEAAYSLQESRTA